MVVAPAVNSERLRVPQSQRRVICLEAQRRKMFLSRSATAQDVFVSKRHGARCFCLEAPTARDMIARGKREARRPWLSGPHEIEA